jgi:hypothetical protein
LGDLIQVHTNGKWHDAHTRFEEDLDANLINEEKIINWSASGIRLLAKSRKITLANGNVMRARSEVTLTWRLSKNGKKQLSNFLIVKNLPMDAIISTGNKTADVHGPEYKSSFDNIRRCECQEMVEKKGPRSTFNNGNSWKS